MCSILYSNQTISDETLESANRYIKYRGPDYTGVLRRDGMTFVHNLLSITGQYTPQPYVDNDVVCIYNGEIYNYLDFGRYVSDGQCIIPLYREYGADAFSKLDGEFSIVLVDYSKRLLIYAVDTFNTKPLWTASENGKIGIASYKSALTGIGFANAKQVEANKTVVLNLDTLQTVHSTSHFTFSLKQYKTEFTDWHAAFTDSIKKRTAGIREKLFIGLSSGYDSGAIACELVKQGITFNAYTVGSSENTDVMSKRIDLLTKSKVVHEFLKCSNLSKVETNIRSRVEDYTYNIWSAGGGYTERIPLYSDSGSKGLDIICDRAISVGHKIYISGSGADEIISDYGFAGKKIFGHSNFGGLFPENLESVFPWPSFYGSTMRAYLDKEEYIAGSHGIETRYPFLDKYLAQEFLWLDVKLKNSKYKSAIHEYLIENTFPFAVEKRGFNPV